MPTLKQRRYNFLIDAGFNHKESVELSKQYTLSQMRSLPYLQNMIRQRRLYRANAIKRNLTYSQYKQMISNLYDKNQYKDIWDILRKYRKQTIDEGDYIPPKRKGTHHKGKINKGNIKEQKQRRRQRTSLEEYERGRGR